MFRLLKLEVVHWDYWQRFSVPLDASIITIVGPNGSGKTTLLDAMRTLLALDCSKKRDYKRYARKSGEEFTWLRGIVDNSRSPAGGHPFFPILNERITLACRIEKKGGDWARLYCIAEGEQEIEMLKDKGVWMGVTEFRRRLLDAGLTPAITQVLSLEQGQTDKLCELSPKALLNLVFQVFGNQEVLDRYEEAREHQTATGRELQELDAQLEKLALQIERLTNQVNRLRQYQALQQERTALASEIKPRLEYLQLLESIRMARVHLTGARREWRAKNAEQAALTARLPGIESAITGARADYRLAESAEREAIAARDAVNQEIGGYTQMLKDRARLTRLVEQSGVVDPQTAARRLGEAERERAQTDAQLAALRNQASDTERTLQLLDSGRRADPPDVQTMRAELDGAGIAHDLLAEIVEMPDETWQAALEAALAPFKHIVLLRREDDRAHAWSLGEKLRYRHFIVPDCTQAPAPTPGSLLEIVRFQRPAPSWLIQTLDRTQRVEDAEAGAQLPRGQDWITRAGYLRERRGGRYAGVRPADWHFGRARAAALREALKELHQRIAALELQRTDFTRVIERERAGLLGLDAAKDLAARAEEFAQAEADLAAGQARATQQEEHLAALQQARKAADLRANSAQRERDDAQRMLAELARKIKELAQECAREEQKKRLQRLRHDQAKFPVAWRDLAANQALQEQYGSAANVDMRLREIEHRLESEEWITDETVLQLRDKFREDHERQSTEQTRRQLENARAQNLTDAAREAYIDVLRATVRNYAKNLRALGEIANIAVDATLPHLANDDVTLAQAGLEVKFNFDDKGFMSMNDGDASGGQQVMKSLILLIALMMEDSRPGGFVFIDEPFAHLDIFNIDRVANFLRETRAQYLITTPITHNVNVYDPSMLTLVTFKKRPSEPWAPKIGMLLRDHATRN